MLLAPTSRRTLAPPARDREKLGCFGLTEPDFGSNPGGMRTRARKVGDEYILNGEKMWITSGSIADVAVIWAKVEDERTTSASAASSSKPTAPASPPTMSTANGRCAPQSLRVFHCRTSTSPPSNLLPGTGGLKSPLMCLNQARYGIAWGAIGAAMSCYDTALQYSLLRKQFHDEPIASHQLVQEKLAWMISEISKASSRPPGRPPEG